MKQVLIILAVVFVVMGIIATAGLLYVGYRVKNRIEREAASLRHDTSRSTPVTVAAATGATGRHVDACSLLSKEEASQILGVAVERTQSKESGGQSTCQYFAKARSQEEKMASVANAFGAIAKGGATPEPEVKANEAYKIGRQTGMDAIGGGMRHQPAGREGHEGMHAMQALHGFGRRDLIGRHGGREDNGRPRRNRRRGAHGTGRFLPGLRQGPDGGADRPEPDPEGPGQGRRDGAHDRAEALTPGASVRRAQVGAPHSR